MGGLLLGHQKSRCKRQNSVFSYPSTINHPDKNLDKSQDWDQHQENSESQSLLEKDSKEYVHKIDQRNHLKVIGEDDLLTFSMKEKEKGEKNRKIEIGRERRSLTNHVRGILNQNQAQAQANDEETCRSRTTKAGRKRSRSSSTFASKDFLRMRRIDLLLAILSTLYTVARCWTYPLNLNTLNPSSSTIRSISSSSSLGSASSHVNTNYPFSTRILKSKMNNNRRSSTLTMTNTIFMGASPPSSYKQHQQSLQSLHLIATSLLSSSLSSSSSSLSSSTSSSSQRMVGQYTQQRERQEQGVLYGMLGNQDYEFNYGFGGNHMPNSSSANGMLGVNPSDQGAKNFLDLSHRDSGSSGSPSAPLTDSYKYTKRDFQSKFSASKFYLKATTVAPERSSLRRGSIQDIESVGIGVSAAVGVDEEQADEQKRQVEMMAYGDSNRNKDGKNGQQKNTGNIESNKETAAAAVSKREREEVCVDISTTPNFFRDVHVSAVTTAPLEPSVPGLDEASGNISHSSFDIRRDISTPIYDKTGLKVLLLGKPCSGKEDQAPMLSRKYGLVHVCVGLLVRMEIRKGTPLGLIAKEQIAKGGEEELSNELIVMLIKKRLSEEDCTSKGYILDGFPNTIEQAKLLEREGISQDIIIHLDRPDHLVWEWAMGRYIDSATGVTYHPKFHPAPSHDDALLKRLVWRHDDTPDVLAKKLKTFTEYTTQLLEKHADRTISIGTCQSDVEVFSAISREIEESVFNHAKSSVTTNQEGGSSKLIDRQIESPTLPTDSSSISQIIKQEEEVRQEAQSQATGSNISSKGAGALMSTTSTTVVSPIPPSINTNTDSSNIDNKKRVGIPKKKMTLNEVLNTLNDYNMNDYVKVIVGEDASNIIGYVEHDFLKELIPYNGQAVEIGSDYVRLAPHAVTLEERSLVVEALVNSLAECGVLNPKNIRHEAQDVRHMYKPDYMAPPLLRLERGALVNFGIPIYGIHVNGYYRDEETGKTKMWLGKRAKSKATYAGMWDCMVAGAQPSGYSFTETAVKECEEEAAIPQDLLDKLKPVGIVSYRYRTRRGLSSKLIAIFDLELPKDFKPHNTDGEVEDFHLVDLDDALTYVEDELYNWKPNSALTVVDFAIRHGEISADHSHYFQINHLLRGAYCLNLNSVIE